MLTRSPFDTEQVRTVVLNQTAETVRVSIFSAFTPHWGGGLGVWLFGGDEETPRLRALRERPL